MDIILELLGALFKGMNPGQIALVLIVIGFATFTSVSTILNIVKKRMGVTSLFGGGGDRATLLSLKDTLDKMQISDDERDKVNNLSRQKDFDELESSYSDGNETLEKFIESLDTIEDKLQVMKSEITKASDEVKYEILKEIEGFRRDIADNRSSVNSMIDSHKILLLNILDGIGKIRSQVENNAEYLKTSIPELKQFSREMSKDISTLSREVALMEANVQNQLNRQRSIELK